jgi:hypothetical protein
MRSFDEICFVTEGMRLSDGPLKRQMQDVRARYNGDWVLPVPDVEGAPHLPPLTPALIADAVDNIALAAGGIMPFIHCPPIDAGKQTGVRSREFADIRSKALKATWFENNMKLVMRRAYRQLAGYATTCFVVLPDFETGVPMVRLRDPLSAYPEPKDPEDLTLPNYVAFVYGKSGHWIAKNYPESTNIVNDRDLDEMWDLVEWVDAEHVVVGIIGPRNKLWNDTPEYLMGARMELRRWANKAGVVTAVIPHRVTLDRVASQVANICGITDLMAKLMALDIIATEKSIFPDTYIIGKAGQAPTLVGGKWKDGRDGDVNVILDADAVGQLRATPDPNNKATMDRLERNARVSTSNVPQFGGETYGALRTGRGIDALGGMAVDPKVQELQEIMEVAGRHLNEAIFATYEGYHPRKQFSLYTGGTGAGGVVEFQPSTHFESRQNAVNYAVPGADVQGTTVNLGQLLGTKAISLTTFRSKHPWIDDPDAEARLRTEEDLEEAVMIGFLEQVRSGAIPLIDAVNVESYVRAGNDIIQAILQADEDARARQAALPPTPPAADNQMAMPPGMQPGLSMPGMGAEAGLGPGGEPLPPNIPPPEPSQGNFRKLVLALNAGRSR